MLKKHYWIIALVLIVLYGVYSYVRPADAEDLSDVKLYEPPPRTNLILLSPEPFTLLDSSRTRKQSTMNLLNQIQEGLVRVNEKQEIVPALASSYVADTQNKVFTFTIRQEAKWSDGQPVKAGDFQYAWLRALHPESDLPNPNLFYAIHNAEAYKTGKVNETQVGIKVLDDHRLQVTLNRSFPDFPQLLIQTPYFPMRKDIVDAYQDSYGTDENTLVYSGPFRLKTFTSDLAILYPNETYWDIGNVKTEEVKINVEPDTTKYGDLYQSDKVDVITVSGELNTSSQSNPELVRVSGNKLAYLQINLGDNILSNFKIRKGISSTLDRKPIVESIKTYAITTDRIIINKLDQLHQNNGVDFLEKEVLELSKKKTELEFSILVEDTPVQKKIGQNIADQIYRTFQIRTNVKEVSVAKQKQEEYKGAYDFSLANWSIKDPIQFLENWHSKSPYNTSHYSNPKFDQLLDQAKNNPTDAANQRALLEQAEQVLLQEDAAAIPLFFYGSSWLQKPRVKGIVYHPAGPEYTLKWATLAPPKKNS